MVLKIKKIIPLFLLMAIVLVGCGNGKEDVTAEYFPENTRYDLSNDYLRESFNFDSGEFAFSVRNQEDKTTDVYLPTTVNKVDTFEEFDVVQFDFEMENSNVPDYDWTQHYTRTTTSRPETFTKKIVNDHETYIIKQVENSVSSGESYLLLPSEGVDEDRLNNLLEAESADEFREMGTDVEYFLLTKK